MDDAPIREVVIDDASHKAVNRIVVGALALLAVVVCGMIGYLASGWSFSDALYMVAITISGVGYGEVHEVDSIYLRVHTMLVIGFGLVATGYMVAGILQLVTGEEIRRLLGHKRVKRQIESLSGHIIVAGLGRMGMLVCTELESVGTPFVLIERAPDRAEEAEHHGWLHVHGDATEERVLQEAGLHRAKALVTAIPSDAENAFITLTARQMAPETIIVARAEMPSSQKKLRQAGANHVVLPAAIGAHRIVSMLTNPSAVEFAELVTHRSSLAIEMDEFIVREPGPMIGRTLRDLDVGRRTGVIVIAIKRADGRVQFPPPGDEPLAVGDSVVLLSRRENLDQFRTQFRQS